MQVPVVGAQDRQPFHAANSTCCVPARAGTARSSARR
jgi:hypothetical protein